jgi:hypothetical protein
MGNTVANQIRHPHKKNGESDNLNIRKRVYYREGRSSMLFCENITVPAAKVLISSIRDNMKKLGVQLYGNLIITQ